MLYDLVVGISVPYILWLTVAVGVASLRTLQLLPDYFSWHRHRTFQKQTLLLLPGFCLLGSWADYQRINFLILFLSHRTDPPRTLFASTLIMLIVGTVGVAMMMWPLLIAALGKDMGHEAWGRFIILGILSGLFSVTYLE